MFCKGGNDVGVVFSFVIWNKVIELWVEYDLVCFFIIVFFNFSLLSVILVIFIIFVLWLFGWLGLSYSSKKFLIRKFMSLFLFLKKFFMEYFFYNNGSVFYLCFFNFY